MKFLVDSMLGRLARFLRIFGYDTVYANDLVDYFKVDPVPDELLVDYAKENKRLFITKDYPLYKSNKKELIFLQGNGIYNYLQQLSKELKLEFKFNLNHARCSICNSSLKQISKISAKNLLLKETYNNYNEFYQCSNCRKVYWKGSHIEDIEKKIGGTAEFI
jgi:uncharacterized protein with PIN domain